MRKLPVLFLTLFFSAIFCFSQSDVHPLKKTDWVFSEPDFNLNIEKGKIKTGNHKFNFSRKAANDAELLLTRKAEALYPKGIAAENEGTTEEVKKFFSPSVEESPFWSISSFNGVKVARIVSTRAINYYWELSLVYLNGQKPIPVNISRTDFDYGASVTYFDKYNFKGESFENVNVVFMKMKWFQQGENLSGIGFLRQKLVIFDKNNKPLAMFIDIGTDVLR